MAEIQPFAGIQYRDADLSRVLAPPYDVIPPAYRDELYARDPHNVVRVILNRTHGDEGYAEAGETFRRWQAEGVLQADATPAVYVLEQAFAEAGRTLRRFGLLARFRAEDPAARVILPHEHTRAAAKEDRWRVLLATKANFSPIFLMFPDPGAVFAPLALEAIGHPPDRAVHRRRRGGPPDVARRGARPRLPIPGAPRRREVLHRRRAPPARDRAALPRRGRPRRGLDARLLHADRGSGPPGAAVPPDPVGGAVARGRGDAPVERVPAHPAAGRRRRGSAVAASPAPYAFALAEPGKGALVVEAEPGSERLLSPEAPACLRALDTYFLHHAVLGPLLGVPDAAVSYVHSQAEAEEALAKGACRLAVLMRATPVRQIVDVADAGESMPAKSTFFHPKLPSGLVIHPLVA